MKTNTGAHNTGAKEPKATAALHMTGAKELKATAAAAVEAILKTESADLMKKIDIEGDGRKSAEADMEVRKKCAESFVCGECITRMCSCQPKTPGTQNIPRPGLNHSSSTPM